MPAPSNFDEEEAFGVDEDAVVYAGRPVAENSEQARLTRALRRKRERNATVGAALQDWDAISGGGQARNPENLQAAITGGLIRPQQPVPVLPVMGQRITDRGFTEAAGASSTLPGGFGIQPYARGAGNRRQRAFDDRLEEQARRRDNQAYEYDLKLGNTQEAYRMRKALAAFGAGLGEKRTRLSAYLRDQSRAAELAGKKEKPTSWLDKGRFAEWEREQREQDYKRKLVEAKGVETPELEAMRKREIEIDPSKKWRDETELKKKDANRDADTRFKEEQALELKRRRDAEDTARTEAEKGKKSERRAKAFAAVKTIRRNASERAWQKAERIASDGYDYMGMSPEERKAEIEKVYKPMLEQELRDQEATLSDEERDILREEGMYDTLFPPAATPAPTGGAGAPGPGGAGGPGARGGAGNRPPPLARGRPAGITGVAGPYRENIAEADRYTQEQENLKRAREAAADEARRAGPAPIRRSKWRVGGNGVERQDQPGQEFPGEGAEPQNPPPPSREVERRDPRELVMKTPASPWNMKRASEERNMTEEQGQAAADRVVENRPDSIAARLFREDAARRRPSASMEGSSATTARATAISILNRLPPEERAAEIARMKADPEKYLARGVPVYDIIGPSGSMT